MHRNRSGSEGVGKKRNDERRNHGAWLQKLRRPLRISPTPMTSKPASHQAPSFGEAFRFWLKLGFISFGGPAGQIAIMQTELVEKKRWISQSRFLHALNFSMLLPGPEAQQLAIYVGWLLHKTW